MKGSFKLCHAFALDTFLFIWLQVFLQECKIDKLAPLDVELTAALSTVQPAFEDE